jgi:alanine racemase
VALNGELTIDLEAIAANWRALDALSAPNVETAAVIKADAYGCGVRQVGAALASAGARTFFVALPDEGVILRDTLGPSPTIYILAGYTVETPTRSDYKTHNLRPILNSADQATTWFRDHQNAPCAIQIDTGMNRLGMEADEFASLGALPNSVRVIMSHLACADDRDHPQNPAQLAEFNRLTEAIRDLPRSLSATAGTLLDAEYHFDMTRIGIGLYGGWPFTASQSAVSLQLPIIQIRDVAQGEIVGYGATWTAQRPSRIATLTSGYADGLIRAMGNGAMGYIDGHPAPFAGRVSMDLITLDVTDCPSVNPGATVEILGPNQTIDDLATAAGTIGHEILTSLGTRYQRRYTRV